MVRNDIILKIYENNNELGMAGGYSIAEFKWFPSRKSKILSERYEEKKSEKTSSKEAG